MTPSTSKTSRRLSAATIAALVAGTLAVGTALPASAAPACRRSVTVSDRGDDGGTQQLRAAIGVACPGALIRVVSGAITLAAGPLVIDKDLSISPVGPSSRPLVIDAAGASRVLDISDATVSLSDLTIKGGSADAGAGIRNLRGTLSLSNVVVTGNTATGDGGGVESIADATGDASVTIDHSVINGNTAGARGGGLLNLAAGGHASAHVLDSTIATNTAPGGGGIVGVASSGGTSSMELAGASFVQDNVGGKRFGQRGGGVVNVALAGSSATLDARGSVVIARNSASYGAGVTNSSDGDGVATVTLHDHTSVSANTARVTAGGVVNVSDGTGSATTQLVDDAIVTSNTSGLTGGGASNIAGNGTALLLLADRSSITANTAAVAGGVFNNPVSGIATVTRTGSATISGNAPDDCWGC